MEAITTKRREIAAQIRVLTVQLAHLDAVIALFEPECRPRSGHKARAVLDALRDGGERTTAEIAREIGADERKVTQALAYQRAKGVVRSERRGKDRIWRLVG